MEHIRDICRNVRCSSEISSVHNQRVLSNSFEFNSSTCRFQEHHDDNIPLLILILNGIAVTTLVFVSCELGQWLTDTVDGIHATIEQFNWYLLPVRVRRMLLLIIVVVQQPVEVECFGSIKCTRDVFKSVRIHEIINR